MSDSDLVRRLREAACHGLFTKQLSLEWEAAARIEALAARVESVRNATLEEAAMAADEAWMNKDGPPGDAIRALATPAIGEGE